MAPFARYFLNTFMLVCMTLTGQIVLCTLAAYAFARFEVPRKETAFILVLIQIMIMPDVLIVQNYRTTSRLGLVDTILGIGLPYMASAFGIFLLRQTFKTGAPGTGGGGPGRRRGVLESLLEGVRAAGAGRSTSPTAWSR